MVSKKDIEVKLNDLKDFENPVPQLEQYSTPPSLAASIVFVAYLQGNIEDKKVIDLGCGTGTLAIAAALLGANEVIGVDVDEGAIEIAKKNAKKFNLDIDWRTRDVTDFSEEGDTVLQNPPFGSQKKGNDRVFIKKSLEVAEVVYSLHKAETNEFVKNFVNECEGKVIEKVEVSFPLSRRFNFHKEKEKSVRVNIYKFIREKNDW